jgi:hypothetical protein
MIDGEPEIVDLQHLSILQLAVDPIRWKWSVIQESRSQIPIAGLHLLAIRLMHEQLRITLLPQQSHSREVIPMAVRGNHPADALRLVAERYQVACQR